MTALAESRESGDGAVMSGITDTYAGTLDHPVSLHKYLYANANPVMYTYPSLSVWQSEFRHHLFQRLSIA